MFLLLGFLLAVTPATLLITASPAQAACAPPVVSIEPTSGAAGASVVVSGSHYTNCVDTAVCIVGQPCPPEPPADPMHGVVVRFVQGSTSVNLATVDAAADGTFRVTVKIPSSANAGAATLGTPTVAAPFTVTSAGAPPVSGTSATSGSNTRASALAATGVAAATNAGFGLALISAGLFLLAVSATWRRPRRA